MKKNWVTLLTTVVLMLITSTAFADTMTSKFMLDQYNYVTNGKVSLMDTQPFIKDNRVYVPIRYLSYACGLKDDEIKWDNNNQTATLTLNGDRSTTLKLTVGDSVLQVTNGPGNDGVQAQFIKTDEVKMDVAPLIKNGRTFPPARYIAEAFGYKVGWDSNTQVVTITNGNLPPQSSPQLSVAGDDYEANAQWIADNLGLYHIKGAGLYYNPKSIFIASAKFSVGSDMFTYHVWDDDVAAVSKNLFKFYFPTDYMKLYNVLDQDDFDKWPKLNNATSKDLTLDGKHVRLVWYHDAGQLLVVLNPDK